MSNRQGNFRFRILQIFAGTKSSGSQNAAPETADKVTLEAQAREAVLQQLRKIDRLTARRLSLVFEWGVPLEEVIAMEDRGIADFADFVIEQSRQQAMGSGNDENAADEALTAFLDNYQGTVNEGDPEELVVLAQRKRLVETGMRDLTIAARLARTLAGDDQYVASLLIPVVQEYARTIGRDVREFGKDYSVDTKLPTDDA